MPSFAHMQADSDPAPEPTASAAHSLSILLHPAYLYVEVGRAHKFSIDADDSLSQAEGFSRRGEALNRFHRATQAGVWLGKHRTWVVMPECFLGFCATSV
jgi:hypothetical protein